MQGNLCEPEVIQSEALINLIDEKGLILKQELLAEMKRVQVSILNPKYELLNGKYFFLKALFDRFC